MDDIASLLPIDWRALLQRLFLFDPEHRMMFPTWEFLVWFVLLLGGMIFVYRKKGPRTTYLLLFSLFFYYKSDGWHFLLLLFSTVVDYLLGLLIFAYQLEEVPYYQRKLLGRSCRLIDLRTLAAMSTSTNGAVEHVFPARSAAWLRPLRLLGEILLTLLDRGTVWLIRPQREFARQRLFLVLSVCVNLGLLAYFKYTNFLFGTVNQLFDGSLPLWDIALPVGISFFTFQTMSYTIDIYRGKLEPLVRLVDFGFFVSFFPQLVAGPIVRASQFLPQIRADITVTREDLGRGLFLICTGLIKKAVISDFIATAFIDEVFREPGLYTGFENLMAVYGYALQIYCDFSGYSDLAIGIGLLLGFRLPVNFLAPYQSISVREFWRRWHISLSTWLRDYLYISLGGNRHGRVRTYVNLMLTMLLGGLWHGSTWLFVIWGGLHGLMLALDRMFSETWMVIKLRISHWFDRQDEQVVQQSGSQLASSPFQQWLLRLRWELQGWRYVTIKVLGQLLGLLFTFHFVCFTWVFFRAESLDKALLMLSNIWYNLHAEIATAWMFEYRNYVLILLIGYVMHLIPFEYDQWLERRFVQIPVAGKSLLLAGTMYLVFLIQSFSGGQPFIYFQF